MNTQKIQPAKIHTLLAVLALILSSVACQMTAKKADNIGKESSPAQEGQPATKSQETERPAPQKGLPKGDVDLADPAQGMEGLLRYRQQFSLMVDGAPYNASQVIVREVMGEDHTLRVTDQSTGNPPVDFRSTRMGGYNYTQDREGAACRAEPVVNESTPSNPVMRLPAAFGMQESGREKIENLAAVQYTFDENSLIDHEGVVQSASGQVWVTEDSGLVLKYELVVEIEGKEFSGTYHWSYTLSPVNQDLVIRLPDGCLPVLADLPVPLEAADVTNLPGFQQYTTSAAQQELVNFYNEQLSKQGWTALPGSAPDQLDLDTLPVVQSFTQPYLDGSQVLVIQLNEKDGALQVILQTVLTKQPVEFSTGSLPSAEQVEIEENHEANPTDSQSPVLPKDLPIYPGAKITTHMDSLIFFEVPDQAANVADFYTQALEKAGWTLEQKAGTETMISLMWSKEGQAMVVTIQEQGQATQVSIIAMQE